MGRGRGEGPSFLRPVVVTDAPLGRGLEGGHFGPATVAPTGPDSESGYRRLVIGGAHLMRIAEPLCGSARGWESYWTYSHGQRMSKARADDGGRETCVFATGHS